MSGCAWPECSPYCGDQQLTRCKRECDDALTWLRMTAEARAIAYSIGESTPESEESAHLPEFRLCHGYGVVP